MTSTKTFTELETLLKVAREHYQEVPTNENLSNYENALSTFNEKVYKRDYANSIINQVSM